MGHSLQRIVLAGACLLTASVTFTWAQAPGSPTPEELQRSLQRRYDLVIDFSADFTHTYQGGMLRSTLVERGTVLVKKPGRMRWNYRHPEPKLYLSDGERLYSYLPEDQQVMVAQLHRDGQATTPVLFLAGAGNFVNDFTAAYDTVADAPANSYVLRLTPIRTERDFEFLTLVLDGRSLAILRLIAHDLQGGTSTFFFTNLRENVGFSDAIFAFEIPEGTEVLDTTQAEASIR
jgi:outer membrane lipoprotein carrier protein